MSAHVAVAACASSTSAAGGAREDRLVTVAQPRENKVVDPTDDYYNTEPKERRVFFERIERMPWESHVPQAVYVFRQLVSQNFAILDHFIDPDEARLLRDEVRKLYADGRMTDGKIGTNVAGNLGEFRPDMRTDKMIWMEGNEPFVDKYLKRHILRADIFSQKLNLLCQSLAPEHSWEGFSRCKIMATCYPQDGKRYVAHYDNPNRNGRKVTIILYLNEEWRQGDGGVLRAKTRGVQVDVAPLFNRLFVFWSDRRVPHEVLPTAKGKDRFAITIWYMDEKEKRLGPL